MLCVGTNYHPHDWPEERWKEDIALMKRAGLGMVRLGHLCWDSYEPEEGVYTFEWFDEVMDLFAEAGIRVFLDISTRPAPLWVHKLCPGCNIWSREGTMQTSLHRYMEDVDDPGFQYYALRFAEILVNRYKNHPALFAFGLCNELGTGRMSFSEAAGKRFENWLKKKYGTVEKLNQAWATQRWSRRLSGFADAVLPENAMTPGPPEAWLDMRRFYSDGIAGFLKKLSDVVRKNAPDVPYSGNLYSGDAALGFDLLRYFDELGDYYPAMGYYPMYDVEDDLQHRFIAGNREYVNESGKPMWFLEFQTGRDGIFCGPKGFLHMQMMWGLLNRGELFLGWTWRSMYGGEEQYHHGILGHDGLPTPNYEEIAQAAADMKRLSAYGFPYLPKPDTAVAFSQESWWVQQYQSGQFRQEYLKGIIETQRAFDARQKEYNIVSLRRLKGSYRLLVIPDHILMDEESASTVRSFVENGGNVLMTGYSATVDGNGQVYQTPRPGALADVFGIRVAGFYRTDMKGFFSENSEINREKETEREILTVTDGTDRVCVSIDYYEYLELYGAEIYALYQEKNIPAVTVNSYGKGKAYYVAAEASRNILEWLLTKLEDELCLEHGLSVPNGIQARKIAENQYFYVNTSAHEIRIPLAAGGNGILTQKTYEKEFVLPAYGSELIVTEGKDRVAGTEAAGDNN